MELFFKWIKQNLKVKRFVGTTRNAVMTQLWIAARMYLLVCYVKFLSRRGWRLVEFLRLLQLNLFERRPLDDLRQKGAGPAATLDGVRAGVEFPDNAKPGDLFHLLTPIAGSDNPPDSWYPEHWRPLLPTDYDEGRDCRPHSVALVRRFSADDMSVVTSLSGHILQVEYGNAAKAR